MAAARDSAALQAAWRVAWTTRLGVLLVAVFAALTLGPASGGLARENELKFDSPELTHALAEPVLSPLARWDAVWYLRIADSGYTGSEPRAAFFPLYPLLIRALAAPAGGSPAALLAAAYLIALGAFVAALALLYRLVELELGRRLARPTLLLLALFPAAVFFGAPYSESVFLLCAVGAFYAARTGRFAWAASGGPGRGHHAQRWAAPAGAAGHVVVELARASPGGRRLAVARAAGRGRLRRLARAHRG